MLKGVNNMTFSNDYPSNVPFTNDQEEIAYFAQKCNQFYSEGIKSCKVLSDLLGIEYYYIVLMLVFKCGVSINELKSQCTEELLEAFSRRGMSV
jgi:hypothetical protein